MALQITGISEAPRNAPGEFVLLNVSISFTYLQSLLNITGVDTDVQDLVLWGIVNRSMQGAQS